MANTTREKRADIEPVTDRVHDTSWSANLEGPQHTDETVVRRQAITAVEHTAAGYHVNLVTHGDHGHPSTYLYTALETAFADRDIEWEHIDRCGCGGYVTRVFVGDEA